MKALHERPLAGNKPITGLTVVCDDDAPKYFRGRDAWALAELINAGAAGVTPIDRPAPRWSHSVWKLKRAGIVVETIHERHGGAFSGTHARYVLRSAVQVIEVQYQDGSQSRRAA